MVLLWFVCPHLILSVVCFLITNLPLSFQHLLTFQTDEDLVEKFLSGCKEQAEPVKNVIELSEKVEPTLPPQSMSHQLLCQCLIFEHDVFLHPNSLPEGSSNALLNPIFFKSVICKFSMCLHC